MANITLTTGITNNIQAPVGGKNYFVTLSSLTDLGTNDVNAYLYYEKMEASCVEDGNSYVWREAAEGETGLITANFTYPDGTVSNGIDYSNRNFNFFLLDSNVEGYEATGTASSGDLNVKVGDFGSEKNGTYIELDDVNEKISITKPLTIKGFTELTSTVNAIDVGGGTNVTISGFGIGKVGDTIRNGEGGSTIITDISVDFGENETTISLEAQIFENVGADLYVDTGHSATIKSEDDAIGDLEFLFPGKDDGVLALYSQLPDQSVDTDSDVQFNSLQFGEPSTQYATVNTTSGNDVTFSSVLTGVGVGSVVSNNVGSTVITAVVIDRGTIYTLELPIFEYDNATNSATIVSGSTTIQNAPGFTGVTTLNLPSESGTFALLSDIPNANETMSSATAQTSTTLNAAYSETSYPIGSKIVNTNSAQSFMYVRVGSTEWKAISLGSVI